MPEGEELQVKLRSVALAFLDDSQESAVAVINALAGAIADISDVYFGENVAPSLFEGLARGSANGRGRRSDTLQ